MEECDWQLQKHTDIISRPRGEGRRLSADRGSPKGLLSPLHRRHHRWLLSEEKIPARIELLSPNSLAWCLFFLRIACLVFVARVSAEIGWHFYCHLFAAVVTAGWYCSNVEHQARQRTARRTSNDHPALIGCSVCVHIALQRIVWLFSW